MGIGINNIEQAFLSIEQRNHKIAQCNTWGHLALVKNKIYKGKILFAVSDWNSVGTCLIKTDFDNNLEDSPWLFEALQEFIEEQELSSGFYRWVGYIKNYKFTGEINKVDIADM